MRRFMREPGGHAVRLSERVFRMLLWAYPKRFRDAYGQEMARTFRDVLRAERSRGTSRFIGLWARTLADVARSALRERSEEMQGRGLLLLGAIALGLAIAWVDSRPRWDDTGITAGVIFIASAILGAVRPRHAWQWALAVGLWIPLYSVLWSHNYGGIAALVPAFLGAYAGAGLRSITFPPPSQA